MIFPKIENILKPEKPQSLEQIKTEAQSLDLSLREDFYSREDRTSEEFVEFVQRAVTLFSDLTKIKSPLDKNINGIGSPLIRLFYFFRMYRKGDYGENKELDILSEQGLEKGILAMENVLKGMLETEIEDPEKEEYDHALTILLESYDYNISNKKKGSDPELLRILEENPENLLERHQLFLHSDSVWKDKAMQKAQVEISSLLEKKEKLSRQEDYALYYAISIYAQAFVGFSEPHINKANELLETMGIDSPEELRVCWHVDGDKPETNYDVKNAHIADQHITRIIEIFKKEGEKGVRKLSEEYGIKNFGRYPKKILLDQVRHKKDPENPSSYGVVLYPYSDHNGAFIPNSEDEFFDETREQLGEKYKWVIAEAASGFDAARKMVTITREYGSEKEKASFVIFGGHGSKDQITLSNKTNGIVERKNMGKGEAGSVGRMLNEEAVIILNSCSTGQEDGIAQEASRFFSREVVGPDKPTSLREISFEYDDKNNIVGGVGLYGNEIKGDRAMAYKGGLKK